MSKMPKKQTFEHATQTRPTLSVDSGVDVDVDGHGGHDGHDGHDGPDAVDVAGDVDEPAGRPKRFKEVWLVEDRKNASSIWTRVGAAFENADGSWNIRLSAVPLGGRLNVRDPLPRERSVTA